MALASAQNIGSDAENRLNLNSKQNSFLGLTARLSCTVLYLSIYIAQYRCTFQGSLYSVQEMTNPHFD